MIGLASACADCGTRSLAGADEAGLALRVVADPRGEFVLVAWDVELADGSRLDFVFGPYDPRDDDGSPRFSRHACAEKVAA